jgi:DNA repair protein RadB
MKIDDIGLIVVDTLNLFYRIHLEEDKERTMRCFTKQVINLQIAARKKDLFIIVTEQVYTDKNGDIKPFTNRDTEHMVKTVLKLEKKGVGERQGTIIKHRSQPEDKRACFTIHDSGIK